MVEIERVYNVPLRKGAQKAPRYERASKAIRVLRQFLKRHMKSDDVRIGPYLNSQILKSGRKNIPHHVEVKVVKSDDGIVRAEYAKSKNFDFLKPKVEEEKGKLKIPRLEKREEPALEATVEEPQKIEVSEKEKKEVLEHKGKPLLTQEEKKEVLPLVAHKDKELEVMGKEDKIYGRLKSKKIKVKERAKKK